jgi:hypothetical protein
MFAFQFAVIHIRRYIEISVRMNKRAIAAAGGFAAIIVVGVWHFLLGGASTYDRGAVAVTAKPARVVVSHLVAPGPGPVALHLKDPVESWWVRPKPKEAARRAWRKRFERRYLRLGASHQFIDQMVDGNMVGALNNLKQQALSGDPAAISVYGDFTYWNCFLHGTHKQVDNYVTMQTQESPTLPAADAEWLREAAAEDVAINKAVVAACREAVNVGQVFDMVDESAEQGDGANLFLSSKTANDMPEMQRRLRAAAMAGSPDAQFEIAFTLLGGYQKELLGTGPDALDVGDLLRESAEQIPQAEGNLAICEFYGCGGIDADPSAGVRTALSAAEHGFFEALLDIGPHLGPSQLDPTDFEAWKLIKAAVDLQCGESWSNMKAMRAALDALSSPTATNAARQRAEQLWAQYGAELGC